MKLPQPIDYQMAIQTPAVAFLDPALRQCEPRRNPLGLPSPASGGFALTFDVRVRDQRYAIRCFHKSGNRRQERYSRVAEFIRGARLDFLVDVDYQEHGIRVGEKLFPIVRMQWVDGARLDDWIDDHLYQPAALNQVRRNIGAAVEALRRHGVAHGDLQHGNILVCADRSIRLVDYDGMYLPVLRQYGGVEQGNRNYQHPERVDEYDESLDLFAAAVLDLTLAALVEQPGLWQEFNQSSGERLLFSATDFADPGASPLFTRLAGIPALAEPTRRLRHACQVNLATVPAALAGTAGAATATGPRPATTAPGAPPVIQATDRAALLARQGDEVTVVGRVLNVSEKPNRRGGTITFINFGRYRTGSFTIIAWDRAGRDLTSTFGDPATKLSNQWVAVTGLLTVFQRSGSSPLTPQVELRSARTLRVLTSAEAALLVATSRLGGAAGPAPSTPGPAATTPPATVPPRTPSAPPPAGPTGSGRTDPLDDRLGRLYSSPGFRARLNNPGAGPTGPTNPGTGPTAPTNPGTGPTNPGTGPGPARQRAARAGHQTGRTGPPRPPVPPPSP
ncbi:protein kinase domain-containing protein, partial [Micromonospora echinofusca]|nr:hypothetical protein [Micromonospora echinofusca]